MSTQLSAISQQFEPQASVPLVFSCRYARFSNFQVDLQRQELFLNGQRVKMQAKVYQALVLLMSRGGEIVTREEVRKHLWPDTFLSNLDANVNTTMNKLRQVLGDSPDSPQYIETVPRRGYSFIARVDFSDVVGIPAANDSGSDTTPEQAEPIGNMAQLDLSLPSVTWPVLLRIAGLLIAGMVLGALLTFVWFTAQAKNHRAVESAETSRSFIATPSIALSQC